METVIIGAGWAGLAAAVELSRHNHNVTVLESGPQPGGRARRITHHEYQVDNGQHLMIGAYRHVLEILDIIGVDRDRVLQRQPLNLVIRSSPRQSLVLRAGKWRAPWHLFSALLGARGLSWRERGQALRFCRRLVKPPGADMPVLTAARQAGQSDALIRQLWQPLCLAMLNTAVHEASLIVFRRGLLDSFMHDRHDCEPLYARVDLGTLFPEPCRHYIEARGGHFLPGQRVTSITLDHDRVCHVTVNDRERVEADHYILAVPPVSARRLLAPHERFSTLTAQLDQFEMAPICTVYLQYPAHVTLDLPMIGLVGGHAQWLFDRGLTRQPGLMAAVISGAGPHMALDNDQLLQTVRDELAAQFPDWPDASHGFVVREKRATFISRVGINDIRPAAQTAAANLWLAGDFINTGYPATLEGAVISGLRCARQLLAQSPA